MPTPKAIAQKRLATLEKDWRLRPKAARLKALAADSLADPQLAAAGAPALQGIMQSIAALEAQLRPLDKQIEARAQEGPTGESKVLLETIPGFGPTLAAKVLAYLPDQILHAGSRRPPPSLYGQRTPPAAKRPVERTTKMSKRGVEPLRTACFQAAFSASKERSPPSRICGS